MSKRLQGDAPVAYVNYHDAIAFCDYCGVRLPSEAEWLAAALNETMERDISTSEELVLRVAEPPKDRLDCMAWDITSTLTSSGLVVSRRGPLHFKKRDWREPLQLNFHRLLLSPDQFDIAVTFRIVNC